jgi:hypothetical protein
MIRIVALIAPGVERSRAVLARRVAEAAAQIERRASGVGRVEYAIETTEGPERTASSLSVETSQFVAVVEVLVPNHADLEEAVSALHGLDASLATVTNAAQSVVVVGTEHEIVPGSGELQIHVALRRNPSIDHDEYLRIWSTEFAPLAATTPHIAGYRQIWTLFEASAHAASIAGFGTSEVDGIALEWFPSAELLQEAAVWSEESRSHVEIRQRLLDEPEARSLLSDNAA